MRVNKELMRVSILDNYGCKIYNTTVNLNDTKSLANLFFVLRKYYGANLDKAYELQNSKEFRLE